MLNQMVESTYDEAEQTACIAYLSDKYDAMTQAMECCPPYNCPPITASNTSQCRDTNRCLDEMKEVRANRRKTLATRYKICAS
jgi:hypothetical protein